jgi:hypothetical protein
MRRIAPVLLVLAALVPAAAVLAANVTRTSRPVRLLRTWEENIKAGGREFPRRVEVVFDYGEGIARQNYYTLDGELVGSKRITQNMPAPSREEIAEAFALVERDPNFAPLFSRFRVVSEGGFLLQEGPGKPCGPGSRCLHVFLLSSDRAGLIRRVVVDLVKRDIPYTAYVPPGGSGR